MVSTQVYGVESHFHAHKVGNDVVALGGACTVLAILHTPSALPSSRRECQLFDLRLRHQSRTVSGLGKRTMLRRGTVLMPHFVHNAERLRMYSSLVAKHDHG